MAIENWIDEISDLFAISSGRKSSVRSFRMFKNNEFPEAIDVYPSAISYPTGVQTVYSQGGVCYDLWTGRTEFHLVPDVKKSNYPFIIPFIARIRNAAAGNMTLNNKVAWFQLEQEEISIQGPVVFEYGEEAQHLGLLVNWKVKEMTSGTFTVSQ